MVEHTLPYSTEKKKICENKLHINHTKYRLSNKYKLRKKVFSVIVRAI